MPNLKTTGSKIINLKVTDKVRKGERIALLITLLIFMFLFIGYLIKELPS